MLRLRNILLVLLGLSVLFVFFTGCANDNPAAPESVDMAPGGDGNMDADEQDPSYVSSITVSEDTDDDQLSNLAKITLEQAEGLALGSVSGVVLGTELENENGNVVYAVEVDTGSGVKEVKIDAGNGKVLFVEDDDGDDEDANKAEDDEVGGFESNHEFEGEEEGEN
jgi:hypothetical protein